MTREQREQLGNEIWGGVAVQMVDDHAAHQKRLAAKAAEQRTPEEQIQHALGRLQEKKISKLAVLTVSERDKALASELGKRGSFAIVELESVEKVLSACDDVDTASLLALKQGDDKVSDGQQPNSEVWFKSGQAMIASVHNPVTEPPTLTAVLIR
jgi:hypothetical protein